MRRLRTAATRPESMLVGGEVGPGMSATALFIAVLAAFCTQSELTQVRFSRIFSGMLTVLLQYVQTTLSYRHPFALLCAP